jgi:hypothetical protein
VNRKLDPVYLTEAELARRWCASRSTIQRLARAGQLPHFIRPAPPGGQPRRLYRIADIEALEADGYQDAAALAFRAPRKGRG